MPTRGGNPNFVTADHQGRSAEVVSYPAAAARRRSARCPEVVVVGGRSDPVLEVSSFLRSRGFASESCVIDGFATGGQVRAASESATVGVARPRLRRLGIDESGGIVLRGGDVADDSGPALSAPVLVIWGESVATARAASSLVAGTRAEVLVSSTKEGAIAASVARPVDYVVIWPSEKDALAAIVASELFESGQFDTSADAGCSTRRLGVISCGSDNSALFVAALGITLASLGAGVAFVDADPVFGELTALLVDNGPSFVDNQQLAEGAEDSDVGEPIPLRLPGGKAALFRIANATQQGAQMPSLTGTVRQLPSPAGDGFEDLEILCEFTSELAWQTEALALESPVGVAFQVLDLPFRILERQLYIAKRNSPDTAPGVEGHSEPTFFSRFWSTFDALAVVTAGNFFGLRRASALVDLVGAQPSLRVPIIAVITEVDPRLQAYGAVRDLVGVADCFEIHRDTGIGRVCTLDDLLELAAKDDDYFAVAKEIAEAALAGHLFFGLSSGNFPRHRRSNESPPHTPSSEDPWMSWVGDASRA